MKSLYILTIILLQYIVNSNEIEEIEKCANYEMIKKLKLNLIEK